MTDINTKIPAIKIHQKEDKDQAIYIAKITLRDLIAGNVSGEIKKDRRFVVKYYGRKQRDDGTFFDEGYQRIPTSSRRADIKDYLTDVEKALMPTAIIVASETPLKFEKIKDDFGYLTLTPTLSILDGQHRYESISELLSSKTYEKDLGNYDMPMTVLSGFNETEEMMVFYIMNGKQVKIKPDLVHRHWIKMNKDPQLKKYLKEAEKFTVRANVIANALNEGDGVKSLWIGLMADANEDRDSRRGKTIGVTPFALSLSPLMNPKSSLLADRDASIGAGIIASFWDNAVLSVWDEVLENPKDYVLLKTIGTNVMHRVLAELHEDEKDPAKLITLARNKLLRAKEVLDQNGSGFWKTRKALGNKADHGLHACNFSSISGHKTLVYNLLHPTLAQ